MSWKIFGKKQLQQEQSGNQAVDAPDLKVVILTDLGNVRTNNEDTGLYFRVADEAITHNKGCLLMVADGMGGYEGGEVASKLAADTISKEYFKSGGNANIEKKLTSVFIVANKNILAAAAADASLKGMGTTCTALIIANQEVYYAHVGDSRAYAIRNKSITRITNDHTYVQELLKAGNITREEAEKHPQRNILTNAMGTKPQMRVDTGKCDFLLEEDDKLLLCSDGLYDYLEDAEIAVIINNSSLQAAAEELVAVAKKRGGHDNITVVLAHRETGAAQKPTKETRDVVLPVTKEIDLP